MEARAEIWRRLDPTQWQIRLFVLDPNQDVTQPPSGRLVVTSLHNHARYDAISYAWGKAQETRPLYLSNVRWPITKTLYTCLQHFRHPTEQRRLWVDTICVNQFDVAERGQQVQFMQHIFSGALKVHVWLGSGSQNIDRAFQIVEQLGRNVSWDEVTIDGRPKKQQDVNFLAYFTSGSWWNRLWILQEAALARTLEFHYGRRHLELYTILRYREQAIKHDMASQIEDREAELALYRSWDKLMQFGRLANILLRTAQYSPRQKCEELVNVLCESRLAETADNRDRVYGFLGICMALFEDDIVRADYEMDITEVYTLFAHSIIQHSESLVLFTQVCPYQNKLTSLPSWVPDWASNYDFATERVRLRFWGSTFNACASYPLENPILNGNCISLRGVVLDTIRVTGDVCHRELFRNDYWEAGDPEAVYANIRQWVETYEANFDGFSDLPYNAAETPTIHTFLTNVLNHERLGRTSIEDRMALYTRVMAWLQHPVSGARPKMALDLLMAAIGKRRLVVGSRKHFGVGPEDSRPGDVIAILAGGAAPYILRKIPNGDTASRFRGRFVGECHIDGIMLGEALSRQNPADLFQTIELQ